MDTFYSERYPAVGELHILKTASLSRFVTWKSLGYGRAVASLQEGQKEWPREISVNIEARINSLRDGSMELHFEAPETLSLRRVEASGLTDEKSKIDFQAEIIIRENHHVIRLPVDASAADVKKVQLKLTLETINREMSTEHGLKGLRLLLYPSLQLGELRKSSQRAP